MNNERGDVLHQEMTFDEYFESRYGKCGSIAMHEFKGMLKTCWNAGVSFDPRVHELKDKVYLKDKLLEKISGMCGAPIAADGCRNILKNISDHLNIMEKLKKKNKK